MVTDVGHLVEEQQCLLITLADILEVLGQRVIVLQQTLEFIYTFLIVVEQLLSFLGLLLGTFHLIEESHSKSNHYYNQYNLKYCHNHQPFFCSTFMN